MSDSDSDSLWTGWKVGLYEKLCTCLEQRGQLLCNELSSSGWLARRVISAALAQRLSGRVWNLTPGLSHTVSS